MNELAKITNCDRDYYGKLGNRPMNDATERLYQSIRIENILIVTTFQQNSIYQRAASEFPSTPSNRGWIYPQTKDSRKNIIEKLLEL